MIYIKKELRRAVRARIAELDAAYISESDSRICARVLEIDEVRDAELILAYYSMGREVDTHELIDALRAMGKKVALPVCEKGGFMRFVEYTGRMKPGLLGISEPEGGSEMIPPPDSVMIVPAVAFDETGYRLGQGGGYYDRYLAANEVFAVGIGREALLLDRAPREEHDLPVNVLVTEEKTARLR